MKVVALRKEPVLNPLTGVHIELTPDESNSLRYFLKHNLDTDHVLSLYELKDKLFSIAN